MWYRDLDGTPDENVEAIAEYFGCTASTAESVLGLLHASHARGDAGEPFAEGMRVAGIGEYGLFDLRRRAVAASLETRFPSTVEPYDLAKLVVDAWTDGIQRKDRVTVVLDNSTCDAICEYCYHSLANGTVKCDFCGSTSIDHQVMVTVTDPFATLWADNDQSIDGSSWENCDDGMAYTILSTRPGLAAELIAEGYRLDQSKYSES